MTGKLTQKEKATLLKAARQSLEAAVKTCPPASMDQSNLTPALQEMGASFVTLTKAGQLRGCIGALEAYQPLLQDVCEHAVAAALQDTRFPPVQADELAQIHIEISHLSKPEPLEYSTPQDLLEKLRPGVDGVILQDGWRRATFLPQVWQNVPDPEEFLDHLCYKMGAGPDLWRHKHLEVFTYQVDEFHE